MGNLIGPDVSHYQGNVDWGQICSCCAFASCKATEGVSYKDPMFQANRQGMRSGGLKLRGLYHFARPGKDPAVAEADHFCNTVGSLEPGEVAVLDLESTELDSAATGQWARDWMGRTQGRLGATPWLYSFGPFLAKMDTSGLQQYPLWIARYGPNDGSIPSSRPKTDRWPNFTLWQYTSQGQHAGINGRCDLSVFEGTEEQLVALVGGAANPPASPSPDAGPPTDGLHEFRTWGNGVRIRRDPNTQCAVVGVLAGPSTVKIKCQVKGEAVTAQKWTNDNWSYLPDHGGYINNVYIRNPDRVLPGVPICS